MVKSWIVWLLTLLSVDYRLSISKTFAFGLGAISAYLGQWTSEMKLNTLSQDIPASLLRILYVSSGMLKTVSERLA